jgi:D-alanine--poly(phosphoribitol) ligase subunit 2
MSLDQASITAAIKQKIVEIADALGSDASDLQPDELIPATGLIDSAGLLDLIAWFEKHYDIRVATEDFTVDKLGTMESMARYLLQRKGLL